jgi:hypothetical protein
MSAVEKPLFSAGSSSDDIGGDREIGLQKAAGGASFLLVRVTNPGKNCRTVPFSHAWALFFQDEHLSKTESSAASLKDEIQLGETL